MAKARVRTAWEPSVDAPEAKIREPTDLPTAYRPPRLTLLEIEPCRVYAYWEITAEDWDAARERLGSSDASAVWVLRLYDVTYIDFDGSNAHGHFDVPIETTAAGWYVDLWSGEKSYCAEIGPRCPDGHFVPVCRSNFVDLPRTEPAAHYQPEWLNVEGVFERVESVPEPAPDDDVPESVETALPGADDGPAGEGHPPRDALFVGRSAEATTREGGAVWAGSRNVESSSGAGDGHTHAAAAPSAAALSDSAVEPHGNGDQVSGAVGRPGSTEDAAQIEREEAEGSTAWVAPRGGTWFGEPTPEQQGFRPRLQLSQAEMSQRYEELLVGAPQASSENDILAPGGPGSALGATPLQIRVERRRRISTSSDGVSSFGSGGSWDVSGSKTAAGIDLKLNAEVVISGRAQPGQTVQVNGRWLKVGADGSFSLRLALPVVKE